MTELKNKLKYYFKAWYNEVIAISNEFFKITTIYKILIRKLLYKRA